MIVKYPHQKPSEIIRLSIRFPSVTFKTPGKIIQAIFHFIFKKSINLKECLSIVLTNNSKEYFN